MNVLLIPEQMKVKCAFMVMWEWGGIYSRLVILKFKGLSGISRYPYLDISDLQN